MNSDDLPMISLPSDSTQVDLTPQKEVQVNTPEPRRNPTTHVPRPAPSEPVAVEAAPAKPAARPVSPATNAPADPRKASEARRPGSVTPVRPAGDPSASRPAAPSVKAPLPAPGADEEDPEKLLREYAERQKTKLVRLEQQVVEYKKVVLERDSLRSKVDALSKELQEAKKLVEASAKSDEIIKDLQGKVDAAILSNSILAEDKEKLKKGLSQQTENLKKAEERAVIAEKRVTELENQLVEQTRGRKEAEGRVEAGLLALQGIGPVEKRPSSEESATRPMAGPSKPLSEAPTRPMTPVAAAKPTEEKAATAVDGAAPRPATAPPKAAPLQRPPGRFSFLKK